MINPRPLRERSPVSKRGTAQTRGHLLPGRSSSDSLVLRSQVIDFIWPGLTVIAIVGFRFWKFCLDNGLRLIIPLQPTRPSPGEEFFCWVHIPNFFLVGAPKCATTAVAVALGCQADIFMSEPKEPTYFLFARGNPYGFDRTTRISDLESYLALFQNAGQRKIYGEASPLYFHAPYVAEEIVRFNPQAKIMAILRDPVERACSMYHFFYQHDRRATVSREDFRRKFFDGSVVHIPVGPATMRMEHLRSFGFYRRLLQPYYDHFDRNQILVLTHDDLRSDSQHFMRRVLAFLEVEALSPPVVPIANVTFQPRSREMQYWLNHAVHSKPREILKRVVVACPGARTFRDSFNRFNQRPFVPAQFLSDDLHRELIATYQEDLESLCRLVGRDFTPWLEHKPVCEGKPSNGALAV